MYFRAGVVTILQSGARRGLAAAVAAAVLVTVSPAGAHAQTTLSTEFTSPRSIDLSVEFMGSVARRASGGFEWYLTDLTFGVTPRLEVGVGWSALLPAAAGEPHEILPHAKFKVLETDSSAVAAGVAWHAPVTRRDEASGYGWIYVAASRTFGGSHPITISAGAYELVRRDELVGDTRRGVSLGFDQSVTDRWSYAVEWISGSNWYGYLSSGLTFASGPNWFTGGYCVGNDRGANHGPCFSAGRTF